MTHGLAIILDAPPTERGQSPESLLEVAMLKCAANGFTMPETAAKLGVPYPTVYFFARRTGVTFERRWRLAAKFSHQPPRNHRIRELRAAGATLKEIGDQCGVTRERVRQILKKVGGDPLPISPKGFHGAPRTCTQCGVSFPMGTGISRGPKCFCSKHCHAIDKRNVKMTRVVDTEYARLTLMALRMRSEGRRWSEIARQVGAKTPQVAHGRMSDFCGYYGIDFSWQSVGKGKRTRPVAPEGFFDHPVLKAVAEAMDREASA